MGSIPGSGRSPGGGHGYSLQYSCLKNPMDRGAWQAAVHGVARVITTKWESYILILLKRFELNYTTFPFFSSDSMT